MRVQSIAAIALLLLTAPSCSSNGNKCNVSGTVAVDGRPVDSGTVHFQPAESVGSKGEGGAIVKGAFALSTDRGLSPGKYQVTLVAFQNTGKTIKDPQRGNIAETNQLTVADSPKTVELTSANANSLQLTFTTTAKH